MGVLQIRNSSLNTRPRRQQRTKRQTIIMLQLTLVDQIGSLTDDDDDDDDNADADDDDDGDDGGGGDWTLCNAPKTLHILCVRGTGESEKKNELGLA